MLIVIVVIAILGTNLLLGFFVANTLGYGPQSFSELLTGIYRAPVGWAQRKLSSGRLEIERRLEWAHELNQWCPLPESSPGSPASSNEATESDQEPAAPRPTDRQVLQSVMNYVQASSILLDEVRFHWQYPGGATDDDKTVAETEEEPADTLPPDVDPIANLMVSSTGSEDPFSDPFQDLQPAEPEPTAEPEAASSDEPIRVWNRERLLESLEQWHDYLENYEPGEITWWLDWFRKWEAFAERLRQHARQVAAVGMVEELLSQQPEAPAPEPVSRSVRSTKEAEVQPPVSEVQEPPSSKQQWIQSQYGRLLQSLFHSSQSLQKAGQQLTHFTERQIGQRDFAADAVAPTEGSELPSLPDYLDVDFTTIEPNYAVLVLPDHRQLLELDAGRLVAAVADFSLARLLKRWREEEQLSGTWCSTRHGGLLGLIRADAATVRQQASQIVAKIRNTHLDADGYQLKQTTSVVIVPLKGPDILPQLQAIWDILQRKAVRQRLAAGDCSWELRGKRLAALAPHEVTSERIEESLSIHAVTSETMPTGMFDDLDQGDEPFEEDEEW